MIEGSGFRIGGDNGLGGASEGVRRTVSIYFMRCPILCVSPFLPAISIRRVAGVKITRGGKAKGQGNALAFISHATAVGG
jgi:hypothetical protein